MSFKADVLRVLIASPSDVENERNEIEEAIFKWNIQYAEQMNVVLLPSRWEEDVVPTYRGDDPQQIINEQMVNKCDILVGVFWTKLGSPTVNHSSGTLEEINIFIEQGKEVMVYFVDKSVPRAGINYEELKMVDEYKRNYGKKGIYSPYNVGNIAKHLFKKVEEYREKCKRENEIAKDTISKSNQDLQNADTISLEQLIDSNEITPSEILMLGFILDTENRVFGYRWKEKETIENIKRWEESNSLNCELWRKYTTVITNFSDRGLIKVRECTSDGNPRLYEMPLDIFNQLRQLPQYSKLIISNVVDAYVFELPF
ncbi:DUF4062 domain-containing protein [Bacillus thuringiensis]|uniref:DUF4062 domain-containing protein n=1 Tax=Bacillus cereus TaxID=1396 RepID=A0ABD7RG91_BACCE|nr:MULTISPECIES: DUF4062 domain-containing protein [Bacillus cereus group]AJH80391.1 hypothetical protein BF36_2680 [Bacillus thuringiensis]MDF9626803.1 DUF4062 domain-containing protein [Bacillus cereus]MEB9551579.1 DUF4062 domain-containing protein [Bacillus cereus]MEB9568568.1 DUF4062 domain-containing protein [Bacillus cereus]QKI18856.1 DUF4062 domain-containing protein [Bacillus thuringiensis]